MRKLALLSVWLVATPITLVYSFFLLAQASSTTALGSLLRFKVRTMAKEAPYTLFSSLPRSVSDIKTAVQAGDARPVIIKDFLRVHRSPLEPYAEEIVVASDQHGLDYRLLPAIAMAESGAGKEIPYGSYNAWGYGIYGDQVLGFSGWKDGVWSMAEYLKKEYLDLGYDTPEKMMPKFCPPSLAKGGAWAKAVNYFINQMG